MDSEEKLFLDLIKVIQNFAGPSLKENFVTISSVLSTLVAKFADAIILNNNFGEKIKYIDNFSASCKLLLEIKEKERKCSKGRDNVN